MSPTHPLGKFIASLLLALAFAISGKAADRTVYVPLEKAVQAAQAAGKIDGSVKFYLADAGPAEAQVDQVLRTNIVTNKKTNAVFKGDKNTSLHVSQSAVIALHNAAQKAGANAVINIVSYYRKQEYRSTTDIECHAGATVTGVALKGDLVKLKEAAK